MSSPLVKYRKFLLWDKQKYGSFFSVEWLVVKDVPNYILKNIKWNHFAVTNSLVSCRDCEKIPSKEAFEAISVFCDYQSTTSAWDDFQYFDREQKELEEKRGIDAETDSPFTQVESE
ncbi:unnamed protein product [Albugo candida]|uniref:YTH domain-containing protein n=1 Tax=Albugo candida TaxID=65357 RepID=A0A024G8R0_9STRA|nr:unnamed protein product [Albugo candida]|eukprot:CCI43148.1 unnamed protein product [Albugo candida]